MSDAPRKFLESLRRFDLAKLLSVCEVAVVRLEIDKSLVERNTEEVILLHAPAPVDDALRALPPQERKRIAEAVASASVTTQAHDDIRVERLPGEVQGGVALLADLLIHREMMVSVATGGDRIGDVNDYYIAREARIRASLPTDVAYDNPHADLWDWYRHWDANFARWTERRRDIRELFAPAISGIASRSALPSPQRQPTGWERVDRALAKARSQFAQASVEEDFQSIGLLCREVIISLGQAVYNPAIHQSADDVQPSLTDANRMLEAYVQYVFPGSSYKEIRSHARASLALALNLQHRRTASRQMAALCLEATASTTAVISIIARA